jgi:hypothetical protein
MRDARRLPPLLSDAADGLRDGSFQVRGIVVKKGEVMSEPTTEAGKALLEKFRPNLGPYGAPVFLSDYKPEYHIVAIEQEARANADRELRDAARDLVRNAEHRYDGWFVRETDLLELSARVDDLSVKQ